MIIIWEYTSGVYILMHQSQWTDQKGDDAPAANINSLPRLWRTVHPSHFPTPPTNRRGNLWPIVPYIQAERQKQQ